MVRGLTAAGTPDDVVGKIDRCREAGVKLPIVRPAAAGQTRRIIEHLVAPLDVSKSRYNGFVDSHV